MIANMNPCAVALEVFKVLARHIIRTCTIDLNIRNLGETLTFTADIKSYQDGLKYTAKG
jgi:hypothetical protein